MKSTSTTEKKKPTLIELIDRYIPRHTREEVVEMAYRHEERVTQLLMVIHDYAERNRNLQQHLSELEQEYTEHTRIRVPFGDLKMDIGHDVYRMADIYRVIWRPDPLQMAIALPREPLNPEQYPRLFDATLRRFEAEFIPEASRRLRTEYAKLYATAHRR